MGIFEQFPYTNFHEINLDWLLREVKNTLQGAVTSVNGRTGAVTGLYDEQNQPPYPVTSVNGQHGAVVLSFPVTSVNGRTGAITGLYDTQNQPPYPVRSVNGKTGAVVTPFIDSGDGTLSLDTAADVDHWGIEREIVNGLRTEIKVGKNTTGTAPQAFIKLTRADDTFVEKKLLTADDIPSSAGVVSVNNQTGVVTLYGTNIPTSSLDSTPLKTKIDSLNASNLRMSATSVDTIASTIQEISGSLFGSEIPLSNEDSTKVTNAIESLNNKVGVVPSNTNLQDQIDAHSTLLGAVVKPNQNFNQQQLAGFGFITNGGTVVYLYCPLNGISSDVIGSNITAITTAIRTVQGNYVVGSNADMLQYLSVAETQLNRTQGMWRFRFYKAAGFTDNNGDPLVNNTPVMGFITVTGTTTGRT